MIDKCVRLKILLIGPLPPPLGGATVLFQQLVEDLRASDDVEVVVIDTSRKAFGRHLVSDMSTGIRVLWAILRAARNADLLGFHASDKGTVRFAPFVHIVSRLYRKPWMLRLFGGSFDKYYCSLGHWFKMILAGTALSADLCLFETHWLVASFRGRCKHRVEWYANSRPMDVKLPSNPLRTKCRRFAFVGHVKPTKGIREIISAGEQLDPSIQVDIYGPLMDGITESDFAELAIVHYRGVLSPTEVIPTLSTYDTLLLPTYYEGEGYPGVILEAYAAGLPVIATRWRAIPEIVDESSGILIEPQNAKQLLLAMVKLIRDEPYYQVLRDGALRKREAFSSEVWAERFIDYCRSVVRDRQQVVTYGGD